MYLENQAELNALGAKLVFAGPYKEDDILGGTDPYSASKAASEIIISSYKDILSQNKNINIGSARAGNVIGGGDWSHKRLIPDVIKSIVKNKAIIFRVPWMGLESGPYSDFTHPFPGY